MISYKEITNAQIDKMNLDELKQYIENYGTILLRRIERIKAATASIERTNAYNFNIKALKRISITSLGDTLDDNLEFKPTTELVVARARLKNLVASLKSTSSTITGQRTLSVARRQKVRDYLKTAGINKRFTNKQLDLLDEVFSLMDHGRGQYDSDEIIEGFNEVVDRGDTAEEAVDKILDYFKLASEEAWKNSPLAQYFD